MRLFNATDVGRVRNMNQDYVYASASPVGKLPNLFVVADGMGGHNAGDRASRLTVEVLLEEFRDSKERNPIKNIRRAIEKANDRVRREALENSAFSGMGTTLVLATMIKETLYVANVGDSRLYLLGDHLTQITRDHSLVEEMVRMGNITREESRFHPDKNIITRAIGVREHVDVDFFELKVHKDDIILMCSDGLTNMIDDEEIENIIRNEKDLQVAGKRLIATANANGGRDNITALLTCFD